MKLLTDIFTTDDIMELLVAIGFSWVVGYIVLEMIRSKRETRARRRMHERETAAMNQKHECRMERIARETQQAMDEMQAQTRAMIKETTDE